MGAPVIVRFRTTVTGLLLLVARVHVLNAKAHGQDGGDTEEMRFRLVAGVAGSPVFEQKLRGYYYPGDGSDLLSFHCRRRRRRIVYACGHESHRTTTTRRVLTATGRREQRGPPRERKTAPDAQCTLLL